VWGLGDWGTGFTEASGAGPLGSPGSAAGEPLGIWDLGFGFRVENLGLRA